MPHSITTAILGTGLIGGSLALALKNTRQLILFTRRKTTAYQLKQLGFHTTTNPHHAVAQAHEIIFCLPAHATIQIAQKIHPSIPKETFITDVVSTKQNLVRALHPLFKNHAYFIGSHPMAGAEKSGFSAARPDLFHQANVILTPIPQTHPKAIQWAKKFWKSLHTQIHILSPKQHDLLVAQISHFPHLLAACLVSVTPPTSMSLAGPGFRDTTRIAASPPHLWTEILLDNPHATIQAAQSLISDLQKTLNLLNKKDSQNLHKYLSFASKKRSTLPSPPPKPNEINRRQPRPTN